MNPSTNEPTTPASAPAATTRMLERVRALLAKAESTEFEAEAEALTAKAQELMARHSIEQAMLDARAPTDRAQPSMVRITVEAPHASAKVQVLSAVAGANRCRTIWSEHQRVAHVFGFADDLAAVEMLFTSLLVQATVGLHRAGPQRDAYGRVRTASYRRAFLIAFAVEIGRRLREAAAAAAEELAAETGTDLVPVLARREAAVEVAVQEAFPNTRRMSVSTANAAGWQAGTRTAREADLGGAGGLGRLSA
ncbi:MAG: DUF2786 domain-containing protein [Acidimicrobiia bacterium]